MNQRKLILSMQITLDGFVAGVNDVADWLISNKLAWADLNDDIRNADTFIMGRKMYPLYSKHWQDVLANPDSDADELAFARFADRTENIVFTKSDFKPDWKNTRVAHDLRAEVAKLKKSDGKNIIAWGGANFAANLIENDLVDEYRLELNPTILTEGKMLFPGVEKRKKLRLLGVKEVGEGLVVLRYVRG
jgi:dihydrofolate reductase